MTGPGPTGERSATAGTTRLVPVGDAELEVDDRGTGDPVLLVQTALIADELRPLAGHLLRDGFRTVLLHRRGYGGSSPADPPGSVSRDAADCAALLAALGIRRAHVVGLSYSCAVALQLAADTPERVRSLALLEPPPVHVPSAGEFRAVNDRLLRIRRDRGPGAALEEFLALVIGPTWREDAERTLPGSAAQMERDVATFFDVDLPALLTWEFGPDDARHVACPVLHVGGTASGPWFAEVRELVLRWFPGAGDARVEGADHALALTHPRAVADAVAAFLAASA